VGQIADLIEKQASPVRPLESARLASERPGEGSFLVSEQLTLDQIRIERRAIDVHERPICAATGPVYAARDKLFAGPWLANDKDAQVEARDNQDIFPDLADQLGFADEFVNHHRAPFTSRLSPTGTPTSSGQELDPMRGEIGGVFKLAHNRAIRRLIEPHDKMGLPALDVGCEFTDSPNHGYDVRRFEFALQHPALRVLFGKEGKR
jgi:hypothetical protein